MTDFNMPLWLALLDDDEWWEQLDDEQPADDKPRSWLIQAVDEAIAEEEDDDLSYPDPF